MPLLDECFAGMVRALPGALLVISGAVMAADDVPTTNAATTQPLTVDQPADIAAASPDFVRASQLIGKRVRGAENKDIGRITDLIINGDTGEVRYAIFEYEPRVYKPENVYAVLLKDLKLATGGDWVRYAELSNRGLKSPGITQSDWKSTLQNRKYIDGIDRYYGYKPPTLHARIHRASEFIGKGVNSVGGQDIGEIKELVIDMNRSKVRYAVLNFDPSWAAADKLYAFEISAFALDEQKNELMLEIDRQSLQSMKSFDAVQWKSRSEVDRTVQVNPSPSGG
jgi:sporulation protein YlmC with PRC-barrel domain